MFTTSDYVINQVSSSSAPAGFLRHYLNLNFKTAHISNYLRVKKDVKLEKGLIDHNKESINNLISFQFTINLHTTLLHDTLMSPLTMKCNAQAELNRPSLV